MQYPARNLSPNLHLRLQGPRQWHGKFCQINLRFTASSSVLWVRCLSSPSPRSLNGAPTTSRICIQVRVFSFLTILPNTLPSWSLNTVSRVKVLLNVVGITNKVKPVSHALTTLPCSLLVRVLVT